MKLESNTSGLRQSSMSSGIEEDAFDRINADFSKATANNWKNKLSSLVREIGQDKSETGQQKSKQVTAVCCLFGNQIEGLPEEKPIDIKQILMRYLERKLKRGEIKKELPSSALGHSNDKWQPGTAKLTHWEVGKYQLMLIHEEYFKVRMYEKQKPDQIIADVQLGDVSYKIGCGNLNPDKIPRDLLFAMNPEEEEAMTPEESDLLFAMNPEEEEAMTPEESAQKFMQTPTRSRKMIAATGAGAAAAAALFGGLYGGLKDKDLMTNTNLVLMSLGTAIGGFAVVGFGVWFMMSRSKIQTI